MTNTNKTKKNLPKSISIALKTSVSSGALIMLLLGLNTAVSNYLEHNLVTSIFSQYTSEVETIIKKQGSVKQQELKESISSNIEMLAGASATLLYSFDTVSMERMLSGYIKLPDIMAVEVLDDVGEPFFAIWKNPGIESKDALPKDVPINKEFSESSDSFVNDEKVGSVTIYYSDKRLLAAMEEEKAISAQRIADFEASVDSSMTQATMIQIGIALLVVILLIVAIIILLRLQAVKPLKELHAMVIDLVEGEGDLTKRLDLKSRDEIGTLAAVFNRFIKRMQGLLTDITGNSNTLHSSSSEMLDVADVVLSGANTMSDQAKAASTASQHLSDQMDSVAAASEQAATNVNMVAAATEEMTSTVNEIASNSEKARVVTGKAVEKTQVASQQVNELGSAAQQISKVTEVITEISEQTNLLALNATIEAARAGDAGRGFAVVANEIKELAKQTANATQDIKSRIEGIQQTTGTTVTEIEDITEVIHSVNDLVSTIATAVEEQAVTTQEISENVSQAALGIAEVNERVADNSNVAKDIAGTISKVDDVATEMKSSSTKVSESANDLLVLAQQLGEVVGKFKI
ncbi:methyl-accepting chemotaxis protein [Desulforhopalus sp. 52FAK]